LRLLLKDELGALFRSLFATGNPPLQLVEQPEHPQLWGSGELYLFVFGQFFVLVAHVSLAFPPRRFAGCATFGGRPIWPLLPTLPTSLLLSLITALGCLRPAECASMPVQAG